MSILGAIDFGLLTTSPLGRHTPGQTHPWQTPPPPPTATAADGTHPTGMHPCLTSK